MIPKIIHYCWFGRKDKSAVIKKCINSWKENLTDYHIREREEDPNPTAETCGATVGEFKLFLYSLGIGGDVYKLFSGRAIDFDRNIYTNALKYISLSYSIRADVEKLAYNESSLISDTDDDILTMGEIKRILKFE